MSRTIPISGRQRRFIEMMDLANSTALAMRRRLLRRRRLERAATFAHHLAAAIGFATVVALVLGLLP